MEQPPPRAFTQGLGLVFQVVGVLLFLASMFICCGSSLLSKDWATHSDLTRIGWHNYSAQRALTICIAAGVFFGVAIASCGLGMQADSRRAPLLAIIVTGIALVFWVVHTIFAATAAGSVIFTLIAAGLS